MGIVLNGANNVVAGVTAATEQVVAYGVNTLPQAAWDVTSLLNNLKTQGKLWGGGIIMVMGLAALVWGIVMLLKKLMSSPQNAGQQMGWGKIFAGIIVGGAFLYGGFSLAATISSGGQKTITDLGGGTIVAQSIDRSADDDASVTPGGWIILDAPALEQG